jgi:hypothetical protein
MITIAQLVLNKMKKLILLALSLVSGFGATTLTNLSALQAIPSPTTKTLMYIIKYNGSAWLPYKMTPSLANLESITGKDLITLDEINSQANFESKVGWTITGGVPGTAVTTNGGTNKLTFYLSSTNISASGITLTALTNLSGIGTLASFNMSTTDTNQAGGFIILDLDQTHATGIGAPDVIGTNNYVALPTGPFTGILMLTNTGSTNMAMVPLGIGTNLLFTNGVLSSTASGSGGNWVASGTTNSTLAGNASVYNLYITNALVIVSNGAPAIFALGDTDDSHYAAIAAPAVVATNNVLVLPTQAFPNGSILKVISTGTTVTNTGGTVFYVMSVTNAIAGTDYATTGGIANTVLGSGTTAANDIAVFTDTTHTNIARSISAGRLGDGSSATYTLTIDGSGTDVPLTFTSGALTIGGTLGIDGNLTLGNSLAATYILGSALSGATDPTLTFGNAALTSSHGIVASTGNITVTGSGASLVANTTGGFYINTKGNLTAPTDGAWLLRNNANANCGLTAGTLTLVPAANDTTALTVNAGSVTGSGTTPSVILSGTLNTSGVVDGMVQIKATNTASGAGTKIFSILGGAAGATAMASVDTSGNLTLGGSISALSGNATLAGTGRYAFSARGGLSATADGTFRLTDTATAGFTSLTLGVDDASPNNALIDGASGVGTDIAGGNITIAGGQSTGTGRGGPVILQTSTNQATGSTANGYTVRGQYPAKAVTLTDTVATTVVTIPVPQSGFVGGECVVTIFATDGTDFQTRTLTFPFSAVNKAGTVTPNAGTPVESVSASTGTLTATVAGVNSGANLNIQVTADTSFGSTTIFTATVALPVINSNGPATVTEI